MTNAASSDRNEIFTIQEVARRSGFPEPTLRYYEKIGLIEPVPRDETSGHRRYCAGAVQSIEALACLRTSGVSIEDMRSYLRFMAIGAEAAAEQRDLFEKNAAKVADAIAQLQTRHSYLTAKAELWSARESGDTGREAEMTERLRRLAHELR